MSYKSKTLHTNSNRMYLIYLIIIMLLPSFIWAAARAAPYHSSSSFNPEILIQIFFNCLNYDCYDLCDLYSSKIGYYLVLRHGGMPPCLTNPKPCKLILIGYKLRRLSFWTRFRVKNRRSPMAEKHACTARGDSSLHSEWPCCYVVQTVVIFLYIRISRKFTK